jgi:hypothetical protein
LRPAVWFYDRHEATRSAIAAEVLRRMIAEL